MDKEIPQKERRKLRMKKYLKLAWVPALAVACVWVLLASGGKTVNRNALKFATVDRGTIHSSVAASGKVVPAFEEIIVSPIASRIMEVYCRPGQQVEKGIPLLRLDLASAELQLQKAGDQATMKKLEIDRRRLSNATRISDLEMQIKVKEMEVDRFTADLDNERYLDSLGSGTGEKVRQAETALATSRMQLSQLKEQLGNERREKSAEIHSGEVELSMLTRDMSQLRQTLDDARILAPRRASLTFVNSKIGASVGAGEHVATIADLGHFRIDGTVADVFLDRISAGSPVSVKTSGVTLPGIVSNIEPSSVNGEVAFSAVLDNDSCESLRNGMRADINIFTDVLTDVVRVPRFKAFSTPGKYLLFVKTGENTLERRQVTAGGSNADYVEIVSGLEPGDVVVLDNMKDYNSNMKLKLK